MRCSEMRHSEALELGRSLMGLWGLQDWQIVIDHKTRSKRLGYCWFGAREIGLSSWYVEHNGPEVVGETIKHEIAHALAYIRFEHTGHGEPWKRMCKLVGCKASRLKDKDTFEQPPAKFRAECVACHEIFYRNNRPRKGFIYTCPCQKELPVNLRRRLDYVVNPALTEDVVKRAAERGRDDRQLQQPGVDQLDKLLKKLGDATTAKDVAAAKNIRAKLRRLGHRGGLT